MFTAFAILVNYQFTTFNYTFHRILYFTIIKHFWSHKLLLSLWISWSLSGLPLERTVYLHRFLCHWVPYDISCWNIKHWFCSLIYLYCQQSSQSIMPIRMILWLRCYLYFNIVEFKYSRLQNNFVYLSQFYFVDETI